MASVLKVDKLDPQSGTALEIGTSGDTITVPSGASLTLTDSTLSLPTTINTDKIDPKSGTALEIGSSGDTITIPSGATFTQSGTMNASAITAGTIATARLGSGTASSSTVLYGDQTYKAEPGGGFTNAWAVQSGALNIIQNVATLLPLDSETYDPSGVFTPTAGNYKWTCPDDGTYFFYFYAVYNTMGAALGFQDATLGPYINGAWNGLAYRPWAFITTDDIVFGCCLEGTFMKAFTAADYVQFYASGAVHNETGETFKIIGNYNQFGGWRMDP